MIFEDLLLDEIIMWVHRGFDLKDIAEFMQLSKEEIIAKLKTIK